MKEWPTSVMAGRKLRLRHAERYGQMARAAPMRQHLEAVPHLLLENNLTSILGGVRDATDAAYTMPIDTFTSFFTHITNNFGLEHPPATKA